MKLVSALAGLTGLCLAAAPSPALSAADTTPPALTTPIKASFLVGGQITADHIICEDDSGEAGSNAIYLPLTMKWSGSDASGYVRYDAAAAWTPGYLNYAFTDSTRTSYTDPRGGLNYDVGQCGGGDDDIDHWVVTAKDLAGNSVTRSIYGHISDVYQESGQLTPGGRAPMYPVTVAYAGAWRTSNFADYSGGTTRSTTAAGASATVTVTVPAGEVAHVGLVMAKGPTRGSAKVYIDGTLKATVNTYAASAQSRVIMFERSIPAGTHRVKIVNVATSGHARIDLDAVLTN